jgi:perosamine synthetase
MLVHLYGLCAELSPILDWARDRDYVVIEDASQAVGLRECDRPCGSFGDVSVFSLYANKRITTGEGGMILCASDTVAARCRSLRNLCFDPAKRFWHEELGWNYRLGAMQAALGTSQLRRLPDLVSRARALGLVYHDALRDVSTLELAPPASAHCENVYWAFGAVVREDAPFSREALTRELAARGIATRTFFYGLHQQPALLDRGLIDPVALPVTERLAACGFYLPGGLGLSAADQQRVIEAVRSCATR